MYLEVILAIIIINYLRRSMRRTETFSPELNKLFLTGMAVSVGLLVCETTIPESRKLIGWLTHALLIYIVYLSLTNEKLRAAKSLIYAMLPIIIIAIINDSFELLLPDFYNKWENYFDTAKTFAFVWLFAMWFITKRQRKSLEQERLRAQEKEKEYKITEVLKAELEVQVAERTAALTQQKEALQQTLNELKSTQDQLIQSEKMASLGELTAGIAHEIQNPLNFVNNFSEVNSELIAEMKAEIIKGNMEEVKAIANDIAANEEKINHHGKRADAIVKGMLQHSRSSSGVKEPTGINALADEYLRLAYHGLRAKDKSFNATMKTDFDDHIGNINVIPQDMGRVILNLITNAFYAVTEKKKQGKEGYEPTVTISTKRMGNKVCISVKDNGNGIPKEVQDKIFQPFFTTKPTGEGTGLGLSMSYDIVTKGHGGELKVETKEGEGSTFTIQMPA